MNKGKRIPVILDTDIGTDIDDTWALAMLLKCRELDVKLVVSDSNDTTHRAKFLARLLEVAKRTDIPVGVGVPLPGDPNRYRQKSWVADYDLKSYPGEVHEDGVEAIIRTIMESSDPITLICIGPVPNIAEALRRCPEIAMGTRFVGMHGSIHRQHDGQPGAIAEYNVKVAIPACQAVFTAPWAEMIITPLDTCGIVRLEGERYQQLLACEEPLMQAVFENYRIWEKNFNNEYYPEKSSSILFDTVAIHLAYSTEFLIMVRMGLRVTDEGFTIPDDDANPVNVALDWTGYEGYLDDLTHRLLGDIIR